MMNCFLNNQDLNKLASHPRVTSKTITANFPEQFPISKKLSPNIPSTIQFVLNHQESVNAVTTLASILPGAASLEESNSLYTAAIHY